MFQPKNVISIQILPFDPFILGQTITGERCPKTIFLTKKKQEEKKQKKYNQLK